MYPDVSCVYPSEYCILYISCVFCAYPIHVQVGVGIRLYPGVARSGAGWQPRAGGRPTARAVRRGWRASSRHGPRGAWAGGELIVQMHSIGTLAAAHSSSSNSSAMQTAGGAWQAQERRTCQSDDDAHNCCGCSSVRAAGSSPRTRPTRGRERSVMRSSEEKDGP